MSKQGDSGRGARTPQNGRWPRNLAEFQLFVDVYQDRLFRYAYRILSEKSDAEDVVQEVLVRVYAKGRKRAEVRSMTSYLYAMVANRCRDLIRKRSRQRAYVDHTASDAQRPVHAEGCGREVDELRRVEALLCQLPTEQAEVMRLKALDSLTLEEIAAITHAKLGTVKSRLRYALEKLRTIVDQQGDQGQ